MPKERSLKRIIHRSSYNEIIAEIAKLENCSCIMDEALMERTIFRIGAEQKEQDYNTGTKQWLRVRKGDLDCHKKPICNATIKQVTDDSGRTKLVSTLNLEDYTEAIAFFERIGNTVVSTQENMRTKYIYTLDSQKYSICFDFWPHLDEFVFISIACEQADEEDLKFVASLLELDKHTDNTFCHIDIDSVYERYYRRKASDIRYLSFSIKFFQKMVSYTPS